MTKDDIIRMAREAGFGNAETWPDAMPNFKRFAALVAAAEREACAKECENHKIGLSSYFEIDERIQECAAAIRARSNT